MSSLLSPSLPTAHLRSAARSGWAEAWFRSDLVGVPVTLAFSGVIAISFGLELAIGKWVDLFVVLLPLAFLGLLGLLLRCGRQSETTAGIQVAPVGSHPRVLVLANGGLEHPEARAELFRLAARAETAMIIAPVAASSWLRALADDVDAEIRTAHERVEGVVAAFRLSGVNTHGRADVASPATALIDGLREFAATEILVLPSEGSGWTKASALAEQIRAQLGHAFDEHDPLQISFAAA